MAIAHPVRRRWQPKEGRNRRSGSSGRLLLVVLSIALVPLISAPAFAQSASEDQYESSGEDQYEPLTGVGGEAANDALVASGAFGSASGGAKGTPAENEPGVESTVSGTTEDEDVASEDSVAAIDSSEAPTELRADDEGEPQPVRLPETGGVSPLWLGVLLVVGGLLVRGVAWRVRVR